MLGLSGIPSVIMFVGLLFMPESPRWLLAKGKEEKARDVLKSIRNVDNVDNEIEEITVAIRTENIGVFTHNYCDDTSSREVVKDYLRSVIN